MSLGSVPEGRAMTRSPASVILPVAEGEPLPWEQAHERLDAIKGAFAEIIGL